MALLTPHYYLLPTTYYLLPTTYNTTPMPIIYLLLLTTGIISTFAIVLELKKISKTLVLENPFTWDNVSSLKKL